MHSCLVQCVEGTQERVRELQQIKAGSEGSLEPALHILVVENSNSLALLPLKSWADGYK